MPDEYVWKNIMSDVFPTFKIGDKVRITSPCAGLRPATSYHLINVDNKLQVGDIIEISSIGNHGVFYYLVYPAEKIFQMDPTDFVFFDQIELVGDAFDKCTCKFYDREVYGCRCGRILG